MPNDPVMLASSSREHPEALIRRLQTQGYSFELKMDGVRAVLHHSLHPKLINRSGRDITHRYPDVVSTWRTMSAVAGRDMVLDGEIIVLRGGVPHFPSIHKRDAQESQLDVRRAAAAMPATFIPFDILRLDGRASTHLPYLARRDLLVATVGLDHVVYATDQGESLWQTVVDTRLEGLVAKRNTSVYLPGRKPGWIKIKATRTGYVLASGFRPGSRGTAGLGSITMAVWSGEDERLVEVGHVASGFTAVQIRDLQRRLAEFTPGSEPIVLEVSFLEVSSGKLRHPVYLRAATDISIHDVTLDALLG